MGVSDCFKLELAFKYQTRYLNFQFFSIQTTYTNNLWSGSVYKFQCGLSNDAFYGESIRHLDAWSGDT